MNTKKCGPTKPGHTSCGHGEVSQKPVAHDLAFLTGDGGGVAEQGVWAGGGGCPERHMGPAWGSEIAYEPKRDESVGQRTATPPRTQQGMQRSGLCVHTPLLPRHQTVLLGDGAH